MYDSIHWDWLDCHRLLYESVKQLSTVHRFAAAEPKSKLIQVIAQVFADKEPRINFLAPLYLRCLHCARNAKGSTLLKVGG